MSIETPPIYFCIQNERTRETFLWIGKTSEEGEWLCPGPQEYEGFEQFNAILHESESPAEILHEVAKILKKKSKGFD